MSKKSLILIAIIVFMLSSGISYSIFASNKNIENSSKSNNLVTNSDGTVVDTGPKTESCPLNGMLYSKSQKSKWEGRRPLGIMVQNNIEARPQSGLSSADVIYEAVAEGGITRFLTMFYCDESKVIGSVRSARIYFVEMLQAYGNKPLYGHVGGANTPGPADALGEIKDLGWYGENDLDQFAVPFPNYWRDYDRLPGRATEHTVYTDSLKLWDYAKKVRKLSNVDEDGQAWDKGFKPWEFEKGADLAKRGNISKISFGFWDNSIGSDYDVIWNYSKDTNEYLRTNGGKKHIDLDTDKQLSTSNVVVVFADESVAKDGYEHGEHMLYDVLGRGDGLFFKNGQSIVATWKKAKSTDMMRFYDETDQEIVFVQGKIWVEILPSGNKVNYNPVKAPSPVKNK